ncbi:VOC family protein [Nocardia sp. NBC_00508]|uniref:VOC family protein n=1 Tax=Nocardia sp. NBC_00508 TaxID=2975992 RepID=UPI002E81BA88|nr:VOC family protein [Nocardia sp. NBC_00508]WUD65187.1 VOC family protein [Nocardia sp. NBC_00508]
MSRLFGPIRQNGYVVRNLKQAMHHWIDVLGVGPFFYIERLPVRQLQFRDTPSDATISVALAQSGELQIELIQQLDDAPTAFREFLDAGREGLHHVAFWTTTFDADLHRARSGGLRVVQSGRSGRGGPDERFVYFEPGGHPGAMIELSEVSGDKGRVFRAVAAAAEGWDGRDPIREMVS